MSEMRACQNCKVSFEIVDEDLAFYKKIDVPAPTRCPRCRLIERMMFRNERTWYRRKCDATGKDILSIFAPDRPHKVYAHEYYRSDNWDPLEYGKDYDPNRTFFSQFKELFVTVPHANLIQKNNVNSEYSHSTLNLKNCYMAAGVDTGEDSMYVFGSILRVRDSYDILQSNDTETSYELIDCIKSNRLAFSQNCEGCTDSIFLYDCRNCANCIGCVGLRSKQYHIFNEPLTKEEYQRRLKELKLGSFAGIQKVRERFNALKMTLPRKYAAIQKSENVIGDDIFNCRNLFNCFMGRDGCENIKHSFKVHMVKDGFDAYISWNGAELFYNVLSTSAQNAIGSGYIWGGFDVRYSYNCYDCNNIFGCIGLRNKSYCILNKQYSEEEYRKLYPKIVASMKQNPYQDTSGQLYYYGDFFPTGISPFAYNETVSQEYFPITSAQAAERGIAWRKAESKNYQTTKQSSELADDIKDISDSITNDIIACQHNGKCEEGCATAFRIMPAELQFYRKMNIPLPRLCPSCRHGARLKLKNPLQLWHRNCQCFGNKSETRSRNIAAHFHGESACPNEFETPYAPERPEIIYCEACYNAEVV